MTDVQRKMEIRWWLRSIVVPLGLVGAFVVWLGGRTPQPHARTTAQILWTHAGFSPRARINVSADAAAPRPNTVSIFVEVRPIAVAEAIDFVHTFDEFSLAFDRNVVQKMVLHRGESRQVAQIELNAEGMHDFRVIANQHEVMGPGTRSPGNPGHSTFEGTGSIVLHNHAKYLIVVGGGTSYKDRVSMREIN